jgi:hypothetical protein|eukprot:COSAG02_NODE_917_length_15956_cov_356.844990_11_plen_159_part_00
MWPPFESCFSHWVSSPGGFSLWMVVRPRTRPTLRSGSNTGGTLPMASDCPVAQWLLHAPQRPVERQAGHTALVRSRGLRSSSHSQCDHTRVALGVATGCVHARLGATSAAFPRQREILRLDTRGCGAEIWVGWTADGLRAVTGSRCHAPNGRERRVAI